MFCLELAMVFCEEANQALQAGAWFAASSIASSALESMLLSKCLLEEDKVRALPRFETLRQSHKGDFRQFSRSLDLGKLLGIATELSWFSDSAGLPQTMTSYLAQFLEKAPLDEVMRPFEGRTNLAQDCADCVRKYRNLLHPAVCLKEGRQPSKGDAMAAPFLFLIALLSLSKG